MHTIFPAGYEWDKGKAATNLKKHGVDFADAVLVLEDELARTMRDLSSEREERYVTLGHDPAGAAAGGDLYMA